MTMRNQRRRLLLAVCLIVTAVFAAEVPMASAATKAKFAWSTKQLFPRQKIKASFLVRTASRGTQSWSATGACRVVSGYVVAKTTGSCTVTVRIAAAGRFAGATYSKKFPVARYKPFVPTADPAAGATRLSTVKFDFTGAVGLVLSSPVVKQSLVKQSAPAPGGSSSPSELLALLATGETRPAVSVGQASIHKFYVAPNGKVYVHFNLTPKQMTEPGACRFAQVYPATGEVTCLETNFTPLMDPKWQSMPASSGDTPIQFDENGNIYYFAYQVNPPGRTVLRRYANGTATSITNPYQDISQWLIMRNGDVILAGQTVDPTSAVPTGRSWTRKITSVGRISTIANTQASFIKYFPDGDVYLGITSDNPDMTTSYAKKIWSATGEITNYDIGGGVPSVSPRAKWIYTSMGEVFLFDDGRLVRVFPKWQKDVGSLSNAVSTSVAGDDLILAGTTKNGVNRLVRLNLVSRAETSLIDESDETEIYNVRWSESLGRVFFDGLRFSDNTYVVGSVDLQTKVVSTRESSVRFGEFEMFSS